ncbi:serine--tRNA ligase [Plasmodiophora brassicae]|uniref:serine--tRNA ligase n=1 Tax=Plasmodiophora brassicae TaxID=37360 RepID=A0A0G4J650_PLABS|nr:hypothetical protein PBRA_002811 [Plasmodiophora brassicae]SPQ94951.1 unnamed protein product [Plasmodiophora brassicae]
MPIDINDIRDYKDGDSSRVRELLRRRYKPVEQVDGLIALDEQWRQAQFQVEMVQKKKNALSKEIGQRKKQKQDASDLMEEAKLLPEALQAAIKKAADLEEELSRAIKTIGNYVHDSVPISQNEDDNQVVKEHGQRRAREPWMQHHHELLYRIKGYEWEAGVDVAGHRAYFLTGPGVLLNQALISYGLAFLMKKGYTPVQPPFFMNQDVMAQTAQLEEFHEALYKVVEHDGDTEGNKYLIATSEQPISALHRNKWLTAKELPLKYAGVSTCFRREAGSHGKDTWGIFRVHQFEKVEQFVLTDPAHSWDMMEEMIGHAEEFYQSLGLSYRVVAIVSGALNNAAAKKYDLEAWFPAREDYRELVSCSNCTDYQSRAMETRFGAMREDKLARKSYVHMLNSTLTATERTICCLLENYQTEDGVNVPEVLQPYMGGMTFIPFQRTMKAAPANN